MMSNDTVDVKLGTGDYLTRNAKAGLNIYQILQEHLNTFILVQVVAINFLVKIVHII